MRLSLLRRWRSPPAATIRITLRAHVPRAYDQVQRLGNPLVSEVFLMKRDHAFHGSIGPASDVAAFASTVKAFPHGLRT